MKTNRDFYRAITQLLSQHQNSKRSLESYLLALLALAEPYADREAVSLGEMFGMLAEAFTSEPAVFDEAWRDHYDQLPYEQDSYAGWRAKLIRQIVNLREMEECGTLQSQMIELGIASPRGAYWFNFHPKLYLECASAGSVGGWVPGDETDRSLVPGSVAIVGDDGELTSAPAHHFEPQERNLSLMSWADFKHFIGCGQSYE